MQTEKDANEKSIPRLCEPRLIDEKRMKRFCRFRFSPFTPSPSFFSFIHHNTLKVSAAPIHSISTSIYSFLKFTFGFSIHGITTTAAAMSRSCVILKLTPEGSVFLHSSDKARKVGGPKPSESICTFEKTCFVPNALVRASFADQRLARKRLGEDDERHVATSSSDKNRRTKRSPCLLTRRSNRPV